MKRREATRSGTWSAGSVATWSGSYSGGVGFTNTYSVDFDGVDDYMDCGTGLGDALGNNYAGDLTVSLWFKADVTGHADGMFALTTFANAHGPFQLVMETNLIQFQLTSNGWRRSVSFTDTASWHHLACVYATGSEANSKMYLDGSVQSGTTAGSFPAASAMDFAGLKTIVGGYYNTSYCFVGKIDEPAIWTSALSAADIGSIWNSGIPTDLTSLSPVGWWRMGDNNDGAGTTITDMGSGGNDGTLENDPVIEEDVPS